MHFAGGLQKIDVFSLQSLTRQVHVTRVRYSQVKVKLSLSLIKHHAMKENVEIRLHTFLTSRRDGCDWLSSRSGRFNPPNKKLGGPQITWLLGYLGEQKNLLPLPGNELLVI